MFLDCALYLFIILITLKFFGVLMCSWWAIFIPIFIPLVPTVLMLAAYVVVVLVVSLMSLIMKVVSR